MCGIIGLVGAGSAPHGPLEAMAATIVHRGPDEDGFFRADGVGLGMRRLAVIDPAGSPQPARNETGSIAMVCNGEIYNFRELRSHLKGLGHQFRTNGDVETAVHAYEEHGLGFVDKLRGMFALALWDDARRRLVLARDRLGIKPLYYARVPDGLVFGSELEPVYKGLPSRPSIDRVALAQFIRFGYVPAPRTIFTGIRKLLPGHFLVHEDGEMRERPYWHVPLEEDRGLTFAAAAEELRDLLLETVESHLVSDVPLGALLSGGVDSSTVVAAMCHTSRGAVKTFSVGFTESAFDESAHARRVADWLGTTHTELGGDPELFGLLDSVVRHHGEPFADASSLPTWAVSGLARRHVTVALSGDGGDELFGGYERYAIDRRRRWMDALPLPLRRAVSGGAGALVGQGGFGAAYIRSFGLDRRSRYLHAISTPLDPAAGGILKRDVYGSLEPEAVARPFMEAFERAKGRDFSTRLMYVDLHTYLPDDVLTKVDRMSMAHSLEVRVPLLDHRVVEFAMRLPRAFKMGGGEQKRVLVSTMERDLPPHFADRPKQGFALPVGPWLRTALRGSLESVLESGGPVREFVDPAALSRLAREHLSGRRDHSTALWKLLVLDRWYDWIDGDGVFSAGGENRPTAGRRSSFAP